jgi:hypothetical protein
MDQTMFKLITATVINDEGESECWSQAVEITGGEGDDCQDMIDETVNEALSRYTENFTSHNTRVIVHVLDVPAPKPAYTVVQAAVPQGEAAAIVTATVA